MAFANPATDPTFFGITRAHGRIISEFARTKGYVIAVRTGKRSAVRWIEQRFPAKPLELGKLKVDRDLGLLLAKNRVDRENAWRAGCPVLESAGPPGLEFSARFADGRDAFGRQRFSRARHPWARDGLVIHPEARLPITSDYDLAAVVDTRHFDYEGTYASLSGGSNRTNMLIASVAAELNRRFGSTRIMHGTEAQYSGSLSHGDDDEVLIYHPEGEVDHMGPMPALHTDRILHEIYLRYFPDRAHVFRQ